jgi:hypothetical protein
MKDSSIKWFYLAGLVLLGLMLVLLLGVTLQSVTRASIVMPILYLVWLADLIFRSIPGWLLWAWFLIVALIIAAGSLRVRSKAEAPGRGRRPPAEGPTQVWITRVQAANQGEYFRWRVARELAELGLHFAAYRNQGSLSPRDRSQTIETLNAPPAIQAYLQMGLVAPLWQPARVWTKLTRLWRPQDRESAVEIEPEAVAGFLEKQLERENDDQHSAGYS